MLKLVDESLSRNRMFTQSLYQFPVAAITNYHKFSGLKQHNWGFPGGAVVENPPANAGDTGSSPGLGRFPHAAEQLGP